MGKPEKQEYPEFYHGYVERVQENDLNQALINSLPELQSFVMKIPENKYEFAYAQDKWKLKEVLQHVADTERIMQYRALRFSRNDQIPLPGFEEKDYIKNGNSENLSFNQIVEDLVNVRRSTISFFKSCSDDMLMRKGLANNGSVTVRAIGYIIAGHQLHHLNVIKERYL